MYTYDVRCQISFISKTGSAESREIIYSVEDWEDAIKAMLLTPQFDAIDEQIRKVVAINFSYTKID